MLIECLQAICMHASFTSYWQGYSHLLDRTCGGTWHGGSRLIWVDVRHRAGIHDAWLASDVLAKFEQAAFRLDRFYATTSRLATGRFKHIRKGYLLWHVLQGKHFSLFFGTWGLHALPCGRDCPLTGSWSDPNLRFWWTLILFKV